MDRISATTLIVLVVGVLLAAPTSASGVIVRNCTDKALCFSGCTETPLPTDQCIPTSQGSQIITCVPTVQVCGDLAYFTDAGCSSLLFTDAFVCDQCNKDHSGNYSKLVCARQGLFESLELNKCSGFCTSCNNFGNVSRDECVPVNQGDAGWAAALARHPTLRNVRAGTSLFAKYRGARTCNAVQLQQWNNGNVMCQSSPSGSPQLPEDACIDGVVVHCDMF